MMMMMICAVRGGGDVRRHDVVYGASKNNALLLLSLTSEPRSQYMHARSTIPHSTYRKVLTSQIPTCRQPSEDRTYTGTRTQTKKSWPKSCQEGSAKAVPRQFQGSSKQCQVPRQFQGSSKAVVGICDEDFPVC